VRKCRVKSNTLYYVSEFLCELMAPTVSAHSPAQSYAASILDDSYDESDGMSDYLPVAVAVQPRRNFLNKVDLLERKARLTSIRSSTISTVPSTLSAEPGPTVPTTPAFQDTFQELHSKPSSVLLRVGEETAEKSQLGTSSQSKTLRGQESSSTLHSFYEPQKLPLIVSQQTSDSSSRDFALRKDCSVVVTPESRRKHFFESSKSREKKSNIKKQRSEGADLSTLFPKPGSGYRLGSKRTENPPYHKMHVKRPKAGTKHWFDSYDDDVSEEESNFEPEMQPEFADRLDNTFMRVPVINSQATEQSQSVRDLLRTPETSKSSRILGIEAPFQTPGTYLQPTQPSKTYLQPSQPRQRAPSIPTPKTTPKPSPANPLQTANLKEESVLFLSSDDEDELPIASRPGTRMTGGVRESLALSMLDESDIEIGEARTVRSQPAVVKHRALRSDVPKPRSEPGRPARMKVVVPDRRSSKMASFFAETSPPIHEIAESRSATASSSSQGGTEVNSRVSGANTPEESIISLPIDQSEVAPTEVNWEGAEDAAPGLRRRVSTRLMPVTRQEETLLAAIRSKKAKMRRRSVHQEDRERWDIETEQDVMYQHRPQTSADTIPPAFVELGTNNYADWASRRRSSMIANQYDGTRASVTTFATTSQRASTRLSQYHSDESPNTAGSLRRTSTGLSTHFSLSSSEYHTHSRRRTDSSHIVVLDDLNDSPRDLENGVGSPTRFPSWAYNRWSDGVGIATVH
jgi:hypothetical protein